MFKRFFLTNGVKVLISPLKETQAVTVMAIVKVGSRYENIKLNGASHFIEHMMFKGTRKRPDTLTLTKELDGIGAEYNAFTAKDHTAYYIKTNRFHVDLALEILSDMLVNSKFDEKELNRERGVIIEEINMYEDNPMVLVEDVLEGGLYGDSPLGRNIAGTKSGIAKMDRREMLRFKDQYYIGPNIWLVIAGRVPPNIKSLAERYFRLMPKQPSSPIFQRQKKLNAKRVHLKFKKTEQVHLIIGGPALPYADRNLTALSVLSTMLGGTMSSRLFIEIRERRGLCYFIRASLSPYQDLGHFQIQAGLDKNRISEAIPAILGELQKMRRGEFRTEELNRAKEYMKGKFILDLEDSENLAGWLGKQALFLPEIKTVKTRLAEIDQVTSAKVKKLAKTIFQPRRFHLAVIGPYRQERAFLRFLP
ncbi:insulinase family protein [Candidatus Parcubacteria bacterium]|jgi:predicted Zn-dependent peptidase|nr:MAG: insulinase family protein [Candidatus Parcubacteria bacterium]